jgi:4-amino-4-deoxy-L-arabinose transferase-like glycosyltransferase
VWLALFWLFQAWTLGVSDDEAYYWSWSLRPALSYFDHPPLQAWITALSTSIFGKNNFAVRLPATLFLISSGWLLLQVAKKHKVKDSILWICLGSPTFYIFSWIILPDICFLPLALLSLYLSEKKKYFFSGISSGLALLAKWHALLILPAGSFSILFKEKEKRIKAEIFI